MRRARRVQQVRLAQRVHRARKETRATRACKARPGATGPRGVAGPQGPVGPPGGPALSLLDANGVVAGSLYGGGNASNQGQFMARIGTERIIIPFGWMNLDGTEILPARNSISVRSACLRTNWVTVREHRIFPLIGAASRIDQTGGDHQGRCALRDSRRQPELSCPDQRGLGPLPRGLREDRIQSHQSAITSRPIAGRSIPRRVRQASTGRRRFRCSD